MFNICSFALSFNTFFQGQEENGVLLSSRLHLACLLWEDIWSSYLNTCDEKRLQDAVVSLLYISDSYPSLNNKHFINK